MRWGIVSAVMMAGVVAGCYTEPYVQHSRRTAQQPDTVGVLTNHDIIELSKAGIPDSGIVNLMEISETGFRLRPDDVIAMTDSGVSSKVVHAMISRAGSSRGENGSPGSSHYPANGWCWYSPYYSGWYPWYPSLYFGLYGYYDPWYARVYYSPRPHFFIHGWYRFPSPRSFGVGRGIHRR